MLTLQLCNKLLRRPSYPDRSCQALLARGRCWLAGGDAVDVRLFFTFLNSEHTPHSHSFTPPLLHSSLLVHLLIRRDLV